MTLGQKFSTLVLTMAVGDDWVVSATLTEKGAKEGAPPIYETSDMPFCFAQRIRATVAGLGCETAGIDQTIHDKTSAVVHDFIQSFEPPSGAKLGMIAQRTGKGMADLWMTIDGKEQQRVNLPINVAKQLVHKMEVFYKEWGLKAEYISPTEDLDTNDAHNQWLKDMIAAVESAVKEPIRTLGAPDVREVGSGGT